MIFHAFDFLVYTLCTIFHYPFHSDNYPDLVKHTLKMMEIDAAVFFSTVLASLPFHVVAFIAPFTDFTFCLFWLLV